MKLATKSSVFTFAWHNGTSGTNVKSKLKCYVKGEQWEKFSNLVWAGDGEKFPKIKGKSTLLVAKFAKKDSSVFNEKNGHLSGKDNYCQQTDNSVISFTFPLLKVSSSEKDSSVNLIIVFQFSNARNSK